MTPTLDPLAPTPAEQASEEEALDALAEVALCAALRPRARRRAALLASGHLEARRGRGWARLTRRRLSIRAHDRTGRAGLHVVLRRGTELVRLPFA